MSSLVHVLESCRTDVRVYLGRDQAFVAQQFLNTANVGAAIKQMSGKAVPQRMRRRLQIKPGLFQIFFQHPGDTS